jgi:hypothetical protein
MPHTCDNVYGLGVVLLELLTGKRAEFKNDEDCTWNHISNTIDSERDAA